MSLLSPLRSLALGLAALRTHPLRTALSTLGVVIGVAAVVAILAVGDGVEREARASVGATTPLQTVVIAPVTQALVSIVDILDETARGSGGFGSTGRG